MHSKTKSLVGNAIFIAIVVVLQITASFIKFGPFSITLALAPIVVGAAIYGISSGAILGGAFGLVVLIMCINGVDIGGSILWTANPLMTALLCLAKGSLAGLLSGLVFRKLEKKNTYLAVIFAAIVCPLVNTGIFLLAMYGIFYDILVTWAGGSNLIYFMFIGLTGLNFLMELLVNVVLSPIILRIIKIAKTTD